MRGWIPPLLPIVLLACQGVIGDSPDDEPAEPFAPGGPVALDCAEADYRPAAAPLRRLTPDELHASIESLFPGVPIPELEVTGDARVDGFDNNALSQGVSPTNIESFNRMAERVGALVAADRSWWPCDPATGEAACGETIALAVGERAYRRPLDATEIARMSAFFETLRVELGFDGAVAAYVSGVLESPSFLYRPELGDPSLPAPDGLVALAGHELATRLSYLLWGDLPDEPLLTAAEAGELTSPAAIEAQTRRMLEDPRARAIVERFHRSWLGLDRLDELALDAERYPELDGALRRDLQASVAAFVNDAFWEEGSSRALFEGRQGYVNDRLAPLMGVSAPGTDELVPVTLPQSERAGILTQPGVLASTSHGVGHSPILRGVLVLSSVLCTPPPPPPDGVNIGIADDEPVDDGGRLLTTREKLERTHGTAECATCHDAIDGIGFAFERYDGLGRFRLEENGVEVDPTGTLHGEPVADALELGETLADDPQARECLATQWYRFALGRSEAEDDACEIRRLADTLGELDDPKEMLVALVTSNAFRFRPEVSR